jgi:Ca2+-binding RTX toxin-like protein
VFGAATDAISTGAAIAFINTTMGNMSVVLGASGSDTVFSGTGDTITGAAGGTANATVIGAAGDRINLAGWNGTANINATFGNEGVTVGGGAATVFGGAGDTISTGSSSNAFIAGQAGNMSIQIGSSGSATIYDVQGSSGVGGDTITAVAGGTASANVILASGDRVDLTGGLGNATINALAGNDTVTLGSGMATVFAAQGDTVTAGAGASTILVGSGAVNISLPGGHGAATIGDVGTNGTDTVTGFTQGQDKIFFQGQSNTPGGTRDQVIAAQQHPTANTTVLTFPDGTTMTLVGITNVDQTFFK